MSKLLSKLIGKQSSMDLAAAIEKAQAELAQAEAAVATTEAEYDAGLLTADKKSLRVLVDAKADAQIDADTARSRIRRLEQDHEAALEAEAADQRQRRYDEAKAASEAAEKRMRKEYPRAAMAIRELLAELAAASIAVRAANADRPEGAPALFDPEHARSQPVLYREELSEEILDLWTTIDGTAPIQDDLQHHVHQHQKHRRGMLTDRSDSVERPLTYGLVQTVHGPLEVVRKRFRRTKYMPDQGGYRIAPLATEIVLPALDAAADPYWKPAYDQHDAAQQAAEQLKPAPTRPERVAEFSYELVKQ
ncbi:hypothetical protein B5M44_21495 [Shinella sumterensis]|uniref:hypothetical protein n=1 Tax=Shinella sumterensis TaxID=1967501 RepID=UPI00106E2D48|nr:hypothetical protein [Shinella sumterensis]MCD1266850.1 hypothetical protein [Shinella sumterensis]TFE95292.1 hypothetical protein B5M44_21495 [Shinella sumterensis]